jgi:hypothetical protein
MSMGELLVIVALVAVVYFLPSLVALGRRNPDISSVFLINLWLGWTVIGWITAIGWALDRRSQTVSGVARRGALRIAIGRLLSL